MLKIPLKIWRRILGSIPKNQTETTSAVYSEDSIVRPSSAISPKTLSQARYLNREISDIQFIERIYEESGNKCHPLLERLNFLGIAASVLDQFYTVRIAKLKRAAESNVLTLSPDGLSPSQQLEKINLRGKLLQESLQAAWQTLKQALSIEGINIISASSFSGDDSIWLEQYFTNNILQVLSPFTLDEEHPFPFIPSGGVCAVLEFPDKIILIPLPTILSRFVSLPGDTVRFIPVEELIFLFWNKILPNESAPHFGLFQVLRDNDLAREERSNDLRQMVESGLKLRYKANVILLKFNQHTTEKTINFVAQGLCIVRDDEVIKMGSYLKDSNFAYIENLVGLANILQLTRPLRQEKFKDLFFKPYSPRYPQRALDHANNLFSAITEKDLLVHWPYESFDVLLNFLDRAASDPDVISIKQTLYRTSDNSPVVNALVRAAENNKAVTVVIELEARDNEASNVQLAKRLEIAGAQIVYGIIGLKIHCKATAITRREKDRSMTYSHLGTGNYHPENARSYTDLSFFTKDQILGQDVNKLFNYLTSNTLVPCQKLIVAPINLRHTLYASIDNEISNAENGKPAEIWIKVNSLTDPKLIDKLYKAARVGVKIELIIRRHCSLNPAKIKTGSAIRIKSLVGRFLEHSRIFCFANGKDISANTATIYIASSDLMKRNLDDRVEIMIPLEEETIRKQVLDQIMRANLLDSSQSWFLGNDGEYHRELKAKGFSAQSWFIKTENLSGLGSKKSLTNINEPK